MFIVDRKYWLLSIAAGLAVGLLGMLHEDNFLRDDFLSDVWWFRIASFFVAPALFGAVFVYCLRSTVGTNWWRGFCLLLGIVAAHNGAFFLAGHIVNVSFADGLIVPFTYGATFALVVAALAALLFPPARSAWLVAVTVLASGLVALSYVPLTVILPGFVISYPAAWVTFGLVYAVVATLLGWHLFEKKTGANF